MQDDVIEKRRHLKEKMRKLKLGEYNELNKEVETTISWIEKEGNRIYIEDLVDEYKKKFKSCNTE